MDNDNISISRSISPCSDETPLQHDNLSNYDIIFGYDELAPDILKYIEKIGPKLLKYPFTFRYRTINDVKYMYHSCNIEQIQYDVRTILLTKVQDRLSQGPQFKDHIMFQATYIASLITEQFRIDIDIVIKLIFIIRLLASQDCWLNEWDLDAHRHLSEDYRLSKEFRLQFRHFICLDHYHWNKYITLLEVCMTSYLRVTSLCLSIDMIDEYFDLPFISLLISNVIDIATDKLSDERSLISAIQSLNDLQITVTSSGESSQDTHSDIPELPLPQLPEDDPPKENKDEPTTAEKLLSSFTASSSSSDSQSDAPVEPSTLLNIYTPPQTKLTTLP